MTDTDLLREAAAKIRETANAAPRGPWFSVTHKRVFFGPIVEAECHLFADDGDPIGETRYWSGGLHDDTGSAEQTAAHITLWHSGVALAVAGWLDQHAAEHDTYDCGWEDDACAALKTARALLAKEA